MERNWKVYINFFKEREKIKSKEQVLALTLDSRKGKGNQWFGGMCSYFKKEGGMIKLVKNGSALGCAFKNEFHTTLEYRLSKRWVQLWMACRRKKMKWPVYGEKGFCDCHVVTLVREQICQPSCIWPLLFTCIPNSVNAFGDFHPIILAFTAYNFSDLLIPRNNIIEILIK